MVNDRKKFGNWFNLQYRDSEYKLFHLVSGLVKNSAVSPILKLKKASIFT